MTCLIIYKKDNHTCPHSYTNDPINGYYDNRYSKEIGFQLPLYTFIKNLYCFFINYSCKVKRKKLKYFYMNNNYIIKQVIVKIKRNTISYWINGPGDFIQNIFLKMDRLSQATLYTLCHNNQKRCVICNHFDCQCFVDLKSYLLNKYRYQLWLIY
jgi:hypothetical protein